MRESSFDPCDYRCEKCSISESCAIYRELNRTGRSEPSKDSQAAFADVQECLQETLEMITKMATEMGIDIEKLPEDEGIERVAAREDIVYKLAFDFAMKTHRFLENAVINDAGTDDSYGDLVWHHTIVPAKTYRAVLSEYEGSAGDAIKSAGVARNSLTACVEALTHIGSACPHLRVECRQLSKTAVAMRHRIEKRFLL